MKRSTEGINIAYLQMIYSIIKIHGLKQFYREFMRMDFQIIEAPNLEVWALLDQVEDLIEYLSPDDY